MGEAQAGGLELGCGATGRGTRAGEAREAHGAMEEVQVAQVRFLTQPGGQGIREGFPEERDKILPF